MHYLFFNNNRIVKIYRNKHSVRNNEILMIMGENLEEDN